MFATVLAFILAHKSALLSAATLGLGIFLQKKPGAKPLLQHGADILSAADEFVNSLPGLKNNTGK